MVKETIHANGVDIGIYTQDFENEYLSLTDIARYKSDDPTAVIISQKGEIGNDRVIYSYNVFPVLYLDNTLKIGDGDGSSEFPYQIVP